MIAERHCAYSARKQREMDVLHLANVIAEMDPWLYALVTVRSGGSGVVIYSLWTVMTRTDRDGACDVVDGLLGMGFQKRHLLFCSFRRGQSGSRRGCICLTLVASCYFQ